MDRAAGRQARRGEGGGGGSVMCEIFESHTVSAISRSPVRRHQGAWVSCAHVAPTIYGVLFVTRTHAPSRRTPAYPPPRLVFIRCVWPSILLVAPSRPTAEIASAFSEQYIRRNTGGYPLTDHYCYL